jgi:glycosyltransferase involved in cell wall biosynthesis
MRNALPFVKTISKKKVRLAYLVSHPIQYQAPLLRRIAREPDLELTVYFGSDFSVREYKDKGFGVTVKWDVSLLDGYRYEFLPTIRDTGRTGRLSPLNYGIFSRLRGRRAEPAADVLWVHGYSTANALQAMLAAKTLGIPVLLRAESRLMEDRSRSKEAARRLFFAGLSGLVDGVLSIGASNAAFWRHYLGEEFPQSPMPYAVDNAYFQRRSEEARAGRADLLAELKLDPSRPVILFASKLQQRKCCGDLLEAYIKLSPAPGVDPHPYLVIVGDGEERAALERRASESGFEGIRFCGFRNQSELPRFFDLATVFVLPSRREPWGLIVNEVMNAGRAVILSDEVGCAVDLVRDGVEGRIFPAGDVNALTGALQSVLATPGTAIEMGQRGRERIQSWSFEEDVQGLRNAIEQAMGKFGTG